MAATLSPTMTLRDFENGYWYLEQLKSFADRIGRSSGCTSLAVSRQNSAVDPARRCHFAEAYCSEREHWSRVSARSSPVCENCHPRANALIARAPRSGCQF